MPVFLSYDASQFEFDPPCEYSDIKVTFETFKYDEPEVIDEPEEDDQYVPLPCPSLMPLQKFETDFIYMRDVPKKGPSNDTIVIYPLSEEDHLGCYVLIPSLRFQEPVYMMDEFGNTLDFQVYDKDWLASDITNYKEGVSNMKTISVETTPSFLQQ